MVRRTRKISRRTDKIAEIINIVLPLASMLIEETTSSVQREFCFTPK